MTNKKIKLILLTILICLQTSSLAMSNPLSYKEKNGNNLTQNINISFSKPKIFGFNSLSLYSTNIIDADINNQYSVVTGNSAPQYYIANDLADFISKPKNSLLKYHSWELWTIPLLTLFAIDRPVTGYYEDHIAPKLEKYSFSNMFNVPQDSVIPSFVNLLYISNTGWGNEDLNRFVYSASEAFLDGCFVAQALKHITGRARPTASKGPYSWGHLSYKLMGDYTDFPSSHATMYQAFWTIVGLSLKKERLFDVVGVMSYYVFLSGHHHWMSSMFTGFILGKAIGKYVWHKNANKSFNNRWYVYPFYESDMSRFPGIGFRRVF